MAGTNHGLGREGFKADINVTPLVDVVLVLLIIFMVVTPMLSRGKAVKLPIAVAADGGEASQSTIVLTVSADKTLWLETKRIVPADLPGLLQARMAEDPNMHARAVLIKADASLSVRDLRPVLDRLKKAGIKQIAFGVVEPREAAR
jgi:biopolymer transport protein ExbD